MSASCAPSAAPEARHAGEAVTGDAERPARGWRLAAILALAGLFAGLALLFILAPSAGAVLFRLPAPEGGALADVQAIGFRDGALALALAGLGWRAPRSAVALVLRVGLVIPACDLAFVALSGPVAWPLALHLASGLVRLGLSLWLSPPRGREPGARPGG